MLESLAAIGLAAFLAGPAPIWTEPRTGMTFVLVPPGRFTMGSPAAEPGRETEEAAHGVTLTRGFYLGRFEVTQAEWRAVMGTSPSRFAGCDRCPVERVTWHDAKAFLLRLGRLVPGERFRLPTEAEWEYACRAGTTTPFQTGASLDARGANVDGRYPYASGPSSRFRGRTAPVGRYPPNAWGLFDLHGNVWEWTEDDHCPYAEGPAVDPLGRCGSGLKVIRGGSWAFDVGSARSALRYTHAPADRGYSLGFRVVREKPD